MVLWISRYGPPSSPIDGSGSSVAVSPGGGTIFVTGSVEIAAGSAYATIAYNAATGKQLWASRYPGPAGDSFARTVAVSPDGHTVFVTGSSKGTSTGSDFATVAYNASTGKQLWVSRFNASRADGASALAVGPGGHTVFVTGSSVSTVSGSDYVTVAYSTATGKQLWVSRYNGRANREDGAGSLAVSRDGHRLFVTGGSRGRSTGIDYATVAYGAATGKQLWVSRYSGPGKGVDGARSVAVSRDSRLVFVTGQSEATPFFDGNDWATVAYNAATGAPVWTKRYDGAHHADFALAVAASPTKNAVYVTGSSISPRTHADAVTIAYNAATGAPLWIKRFDGDNRADFATSLAVSPDGATVFIAGSTGVAGTGNPSNPRFLVVAYRAATGTLLWSTKLTSHGAGDSAESVAVSPDSGTVFATGGVEHLGVSTFTTIAISR